jgi:hypothetical protein
MTKDMVNKVRGIGRMAEETKSNSTLMEDDLNCTIGVMRKNGVFLRQNAEESYYEVVNLINDALNYLGFAVKKKGSKEYYVKHSMVFFLYHILVPFSCAIHLNMLSGNIPVCFMELRLVLESLVECYLADLRYQDQSFFQEKLKLLEEEKEKKSTSKLMRELGEQLGLNFVALWGELSQRWCHTKGIVDGVVAQVVEKSDAPSWALVIPMHYAKSDLDTIDELRSRISKFRSLLAAAMEKYQQELDLL